MTPVARRDLPLLFALRPVRLLAQVAVAVPLGLYLVALGFSEFENVLLLPLTLFGDSAITLRLATWSDRLGRHLRGTDRFDYMLYAGAEVAADTRVRNLDWK